MFSSRICRCFFNTGFNGSKLAEKPVEFDGLFEAIDDVEPTIPLPRVDGLLAFSTAVDQPLRGKPVLEGQVWHLLAEERIELISLSLYVNGISFVHDFMEVSLSFSPFSLVRNCKFQDSASVNMMGMKIFKVSLFTQGMCYYFGVRAQDEGQADEERAQWVLEISKTITTVTQSLFPPFSITCMPVDAVPSTHRRLMAGYLVYHDSPLVASVMYCELHPHSNGQAKLALYENELCQIPVMDVYITECTVCCEKAGISCSCFCIDCHQFAARTFSERKLWLRAISNIKVKLQNDAPRPSEEELGHYRFAIEEHVESIRASLEGRAPTDALLRRHAKKSLRSWDPKCQVQARQSEDESCTNIWDQHHQSEPCEDELAADTVGASTKSDPRESPHHSARSSTEAPPSPTPASEATRAISDVDSPASEVSSRLPQEDAPVDQSGREVVAKRLRRRPLPPSRTNRPVMLKMSDDSAKNDSGQGTAVKRSFSPRGAAGQGAPPSGQAVVGSCQVPAPAPDEPVAASQSILPEMHAERLPAETCSGATGEGRRSGGIDDGDAGAAGIGKLPRGSGEHAASPGR